MLCACLLFGKILQKVGVGENEQGSVEFNNKRNKYCCTHKTKTQYFLHEKNIFVYIFMDCIVIIIILGLVVMCSSKKNSIITTLGNLAKRQLQDEKVGVGDTIDSVHIWTYTLSNIVASSQSLLGELMEKELYVLLLIYLEMHDASKTRMLCADAANGRMEKASNNRHAVVKIQ